MAYTTVFHLSKPDYQTARYDLELNVDLQTIEDALLGFPGTTPPGSVGNYPDVTPSDGMHWLDTGNDQLKVYYNSSWNVIHSF